MFGGNNARNSPSPTPEASANGFTLKASNLQGKNLKPRLRFVFAFLGQAASQKFARTGFSSLRCDASSNARIHKVPRKGQPIN
jgi:hypothetical protein